MSYLRVVMWHLTCKVFLPDALMLYLPQPQCIAAVVVCSVYKTAKPQFRILWAGRAGSRRRLREMDITVSDKWWFLQEARGVKTPGEIEKHWIMTLLSVTSAFFYKVTCDEKLWGSDTLLLVLGFIKNWFPKYTKCTASGRWRHTSINTQHSLYLWSTLEYS